MRWIDFASLLIALGMLACGTPVPGVASATTDSENAGTDAESAIEDAPAQDSANFSSCLPCVQKSDCNGDGKPAQWCVQFASDTYCAPDCTSSGCPSGLTCTTLSSESGDSVRACVPSVDTCSAGEDAGSTPDVSDTTSSGQTCGNLDGPGVKSCCTGCGSGGNCQANGCFGGWFCNRDVCKCQVAPDPAFCTGVDAGTLDVQPVDVGDVGPLPTLTVQGGELAELTFAIVGDTRPALIEDTAGYPTAIATKIWQGVQATNVPFAVTTGDYMFATAWGSQSAPQLDLYLKAAAGYTGLRLPAMGNHECTGATTSNCGLNGKDGQSKNYQSYMSKMIAPLGLQKPYYTFHVAAVDKNWTAKFVFIAANAWDPAQAQWLDAEMAKPTTYTFVVRHEPTDANTAPGVKPSEQIISKYPVTLRLVGHTHTYSHKAATHEVVVGNGGAPLSGSVNYGYVTAKRRADDAIEFHAVDYSSGKVFSTFAVNADGSPAP